MATQVVKCENCNGLHCPVCGKHYIQLDSETRPSGNAYWIYKHSKFSECAQNQNA